MAKLQFVTGKLANQVVELKEAKQVVGNRRTADIAIREPWVSWDHAAITFEGGKFSLEDMGSKTGTFVNGTKITKQELKEGDKITFGTGGQETVCNFYLTGGPAPAAAAAPPAAKPEPAKAAAAAAFPAAPAAAEAADVGALKEKLSRAEIDLRNAVRDLKAKDKEIEKLKKEIEAAGKGAGSPELEAQIEAQAKIIEEKENMIAALEAEKLDLEKASAMAGVTGGAAAVDTAELDALREQLAAAEGEAKSARAEATKLERQIERKDQEIERLQAQAAGGPAEGEDIEAVRAELASKTTELDSMQVEILESRDTIEKLTNRLRDYQEKEKGKKTSAETQMAAMEEKVGEYFEAKHAAEKELERFKKEYSEFEERVIELQAQVDDLTEKNDIMSYKLEQADSQVGELVRSKVADMQVKYDEIVQANQQLKSLIEALEEKVNELDERMEEMEAENAEIEKLLDEERKAHEATKQESEKQVRALKKRLQAAASGEVGAKEPQEATAE